MCILQKIWAHLPPKSKGFFILQWWYYRKFGQICHQNVGSLNSPYYKDDIAKNYKHLPPKWNESIFSILQSSHYRKFWHFSQQNIGSIDSPNDKSDTALKSKESGFSILEW